MHTQTAQTSSTAPITVLVPSAAVPAASAAAVAGVPLASLPTTTTDKNTPHNSSGPPFEEAANLTTCQWTLAMATPLATSMLLMPTASIMPQFRPATNGHTLYTTNENLCDHQRNLHTNNDNDNNNNEQDNNNKNEVKGEVTITKIDNNIKNDEKIVHNMTKAYTNETLATEKQNEASKYYKEVKYAEAVDFMEPTDVTIEEYFNKRSKEQPEFTLNEEEDFAKVENVMAKFNLSTEQSDTNTTKMNIENIEQAIYGELVSPLQENSAYETENVEKTTFDANDDYNYEPTLVTTEAELYPQPYLDNSAPIEIEQRHEEEQEQTLELQQQEQEQQRANEYENAEYIDYAGMEYGGVYAENTNYSGYTYDETTGQYTPNEQTPYTESDKGNEFEYEQSEQAQQSSDYAYNNYTNVVETESPIEQQPEDDKTTALENTISSIANTDNVLTNNTPPGTQKLVKPILATTPNDAQKKKKRVNFVDSSDTDESNKTGKSNAGNLDTIATAAAAVASSESDFDFSSSENVQVQPTADLK